MTVKEFIAELDKVANGDEEILLTVVGTATHYEEVSGTFHGSYKIDVDVSEYADLVEITKTGDDHVEIVLEI